MRAGKLWWGKVGLLLFVVLEREKKKKVERTGGLHDARCEMMIMVG